MDGLTLPAVSPKPLDCTATMFNDTKSLMKNPLAPLAFLAAAGLALISAGGEGKEFRPLFNGKDLAGWKLRHPESHTSWAVLPGGVLKNTVEKGGHGVDILTIEKFWNFTVRYEYMTPDGSNSGFYLRGRHEIQILGDHKSGEATKSGNGSIYNFKAPDEFVTKPAGEWQQAEVTIIGNKITVTMNGKKIHDNVECLQPTGGELDRNVNEPGPILLQGDHGTVSFRNIQIKELPKE